MKRLETDRLILREWSLDDNEAMYEYAKTDLVGPSAGWKPHASVEESKSIIQMFLDKGNEFAIVLKENDKLIGSIGIHDRTPIDEINDKTQAEVGFVLNPDYWGRGIMPEAVESVKEYCFNEMKLDILWCAHYDFNMKSKRVIDKCGFEYQLEKVQTLDLLDGREVNTLYYKIDNPYK